LLNDNKTYKKSNIMYFPHQSFIIHKSKSKDSEIDMNAVKLKK